jgi:uncharacterized membrane protein
MARGKPFLLMGIVCGGVGGWSLIQGEVHGALRALGLGFLSLSIWRLEPQQTGSGPTSGSAVVDAEDGRSGNLLLAVALALTCASFVWSHEWVFVSVFGVLVIAALLVNVRRRVRA